MAQSPTLITSVIRALRLLDAVGEDDRPVQAKRLARITEMPPATTYHLLRTLLYEGYLEREDGGYVLGGRVFTLAQSREGRRARTHHALRELHDALHAAAYLCIFDRGRIRLIDVVDSPSAPQTNLWVGFDDAAHATALGKAVLGALTESQRREYLTEHPLAELTPATVTSPRIFLEQLQRSGDVATDEQEYKVGVACWAAAIPSETMVGAVGFSQAPGRRCPDTGMTALSRAAQMIALAHDSATG